MVKKVLKDLGYDGSGTAIQECVSEHQLVCLLGAKLHDLAYDYFSGKDNTVYYLILDDECNAVITIGVDYDNNKVFEAIYREIKLT